MAQEPTADQKGTAREYYHDAQYIGTDGDGATHFWSIYHQAVVVIDDDVETFELENTPLETLGEWTSHTESKRGEWETLKLTGSGFEMIADSIAV